MKQDLEKAEVKEFYVPPTCECVEVYSEGILCSSGSADAGYGVFNSVGDGFVGEW